MQPRAILVFLILLSAQNKTRQESCIRSSGFNIVADAVSKQTD